MKAIRNVLLSAGIAGAAIFGVASAQADPPQLQAPKPAAQTRCLQSAQHAQALCYYHRLMATPQLRQQYWPCQHHHPTAWAYCTAKALQASARKLQEETRLIRQDHALLFTPKLLPTTTVSQAWDQYSTWQLHDHKAKHLPSGAQVFARWSDWMCIAHYESGHDWKMTPYSSPPSGGPFYGGVQMEIQFQRTYGPEFYRALGTADHWPPYVQVLVADRAWHVRGFQPWPQTSKKCGLR